MRVAEVKDISQFHFSELSLTRRDPASLWVELRPSGRPCISKSLLDELNRIPKVVKQYSDVGKPLAHLVLYSRRPGVFSLGGDLHLFRELIAKGDRETLRQYGHACVDIVYSAASGFGSHLLTYALVQGDALGGGMETALTADCVVMEEHARMGLPEALFNLFPGMGAPTFLTRKLGSFTAAEKVMLSSPVLSARESLELGLCQRIAPTGQGERLVQEIIEKNDILRQSRITARKARAIVSPIDKGQLLEVVDIWVDAALRLREKDLRLMDRLVARQKLK